MAISCFAIPLDGLPTRRARRSSSAVDSGMSEKSICESAIGLAFPPARRPRADDPECFFFISHPHTVDTTSKSRSLTDFFKRHAMFQNWQSSSCKHPCVYIVMDLLIQSTSHRNPHEPQPIYPSAFVVRHAITAAPRSMSEVRMNGTPGSSKEVLSVGC